MKRNTLNILLFVQAIFACTSLSAQAPNGYYNTIEGKQKITLKTALHQIIRDHSSLSYSGLWSAFYNTDKKPNGKVWDMYSDKPGSTPSYEYAFGSKQCGNYSGEASCYNREHSFPKSWFDDASPMYTDLFHLYPTDGYVNGKRSNYPFGEVNSPTWTSSNGSKLGTNSTAGYSGTVFEPIDAYKGDFARTYFYMVTRYEDKVANWNSSQAKVSLAGNKYPAFKQWAIDVLLKWHRNDPVSQKEIDRNNVIYDSYQHNRNPFIDRPELAEYIWGYKMNEVYYFSSSGIDDEAEIQNIEIYASEGAIVVKAARPVQLLHIYDVFGQLVSAGTGDAGINRIPVSTGRLYIVKADDTIAKVHVK